MPIVEEYRRAGPAKKKEKKKKKNAVRANGGTHGSTFFPGVPRVPARRVSMMELGCSDRAYRMTDNGSHSLPDCWGVQRRRLNSLACSPAQLPSLSTALITSSTSESSEDIDDEEEEKA